MAAIEKQVVLWFSFIYAPFESLKSSIRHFTPIFYSSTVVKHNKFKKFEKSILF